MTIYFITFFLSVALLKASAISESKIVGTFFSALSIILPSLLAGFRAYSIGTDIRIYGNPVFFGAIRSSSFAELEFMFQKNSIEKGYLFLNYLVSRVTPSPQVLYFIIEMIILIFIYASIKKANIRHGVDKSYCLMIYYLSFYGESLNMMRQSIAVAISLYCFFLFLENRFLLSTFFLFLGMSFHRSIGIVLFVFITYLIIRKVKKKFLFSVLIVLCTVLIMLFSERIIEIVVRVLGIQRFTDYLVNVSSSGFRINAFIIRAIFLLPFALYWKRFTQTIKDSYFWSLILILEIIIFQLSIINQVFYRFSIYFSVFKIITYSMIYQLPSKIFDQKVFKIGIIVLLVVLWIYQNVYAGGNEIFPYKFFWNT